MAVRSGSTPPTVPDLPGDEWKALGKRLVQPFTAMAKDGAAEALSQVFGVRVKRDKGPASSEILELLDLANDRGTAWAEEHAAELVGMTRGPDGGWTPNPKPGMAISDTTRAALADLIRQGLEEGLSNDALADRIEEAEAFSAARSEAIARTETAFADVSGNVLGWKASGVVSGKRWAVAQDEVCDACRDLNGTEYALDDDEGDPPLHPNCRCDVVPLMSEEE